ncbi:MAG: tetraacyldisaccharide 4'-kinase, partial [Gammaproteobacteria bacterium]|nr:tetraacyldisaccharide 4'-kinase [Gammaproteobacteria bacterium]
MVVLWPLSQLYRVITQTRRWLYRLGIFSSWKSPVPVVVVGNISVGGTGKTPLVIALVELLQTRGLNPGVVSRGYGGAKHERPLLVDNTLSPEECGDEPLLIARRTGQPVCVCAERSLAVQYLLSKKNVNIVVCDDGLQHYALQRDLEIAVVDHERQHGNQRLLPAGPLREPVARLRSVDFVVESTDAA